MPETTITIAAKYPLMVMYNTYCQSARKNTIVKETIKPSEKRRPSL